MSALAIHPDDELATRPALAGLTGHSVEAACRSGLRIVLTPGVGECTCPHDCERDHPNE